MSGAAYGGGHAGLVLPENAGVRPYLARSDGPLVEAYFGRPLPGPWNPSIRYPSLIDESDVLDLNGIPVNDLPSGGGIQPPGFPTDQRISPSEMFLVWTQWGSAGEDTRTGSVGFIRHRWSQDGRLLFDFNQPAADSRWTEMWTYSFIGRFDTRHPGPQGYVNDHDEIMGPGTVLCDVSSGLGSAQFVFRVTDSTPPAGVLSGVVASVTWS